MPLEWKALALLTSNCSYAVHQDQALAWKPQGFEACLSWGTACRVRGQLRYTACEPYSSAGLQLSGSLHLPPGPSKAKDRQELQRLTTTTISSMCQRLRAKTFPDFVRKETREDSDN